MTVTILTFDIIVLPLNLDFGGGGDPEQNKKEGEAQVKSAFFIGYMITQVFFAQLLSSSLCV